MNRDTGRRPDGAAQPAGPIETPGDIARGLAWLREADPRLGPVIESAGEVPLRRSAPGFAGLASIVVAQQVSRQSADAIWGRLVALVDPLEPAAFLAGGEAAWREAGLSRPKQRTLVAVSEAMLEGRLDLEALSRVDGEAALAAMTAIHGIGPWTAEVWLLFAAGHPDIFPAGDVALQAAVADAFALPRRPAARQLREMAESWAPWRGVAARLFWAFYAERRGHAAAPR
ncbi:DNA-3-methyladenine glycosylase family protein [Oricola thermophila]|uniref:DNA-3-methyladenine glycosylase II n=1 Tax=Oricola thermophila TaxID=2742145 RepID=A0A6N1VIM7_9HYPH|nr:DNA-3-methyladenine glycosylase 2 family protein [Oricola thermophila]QKV20283.1 DNA-3-methyladenine glycosylase 2 family protein [Oricola thermophila]